MFTHLNLNLNCPRMTGVHPASTVENKGCHLMIGKGEDLSHLKNNILRIWKGVQFVPRWGRASVCLSLIQNLFLGTFIAFSRRKTVGAQACPEQRGTASLSLQVLPWKLSIIVCIRPIVFAQNQWDEMEKQFLDCTEVNNCKSFWKLHQCLPSFLP